MDTYPCPACGGVADEENGCGSCGRAHDPVAASLARLNQVMAGLDDETRRLEEDQSELRARRARLQAQRLALTHAIVERLSAEGVTRTSGRWPGGAAKPGRTAPGQRAGQTTRYQTGRAPGPRTSPAPAQRTGLSPNGTATSPLDAVPGGAETSPRSAQNTLLTLGGVLLAIALIIFTGLFYTTTEPRGRAVILAIATTLALGVPVLLTRQTLTATAETITGVGLLLVLLDGYAAYRADLAGLASVPPYLYAAILCALVAGVAAAYRLTTHLRAPQFAALLAVQPFLPLLAVHFAFDRDGFSAVLALVAALNLASVVLLSRDVRIITRRRLRSAASWPRRLRELAWVLFGVALAMSAVLALTGLAVAGTVGDAFRASLVLLMAAGVGIAGGQLSGQAYLRHIAAGAAALAMIASVSRVNALALPQYTLVVTAAVAAAIAVAAGFLPAELRQGPQLGSLIGAALAALVVVAGALGTAVSAVQAAVTPQPWSAETSLYAERVQTASWQVPAAAVLLTMLAVAAVPDRWRLDAVVAGGFVVVLAAPSTGSLTWWAVPLLATCASTAATTAALYANEGRSALVRSTTAGLLGLYAVATGLATAELTAAICAALTLIAGTAAVLPGGWPGRFGRYSDRVADSAGGAAAITLPVAVGTYAWLAGAPSGVLLPTTMLATAVGVVGAALSQVAAQMPRTGSAGGALVAAAGCVLLSLQIDGAELADVGLAVLLFTAGAVTAASRAFEIPESVRFSWNGRFYRSGRLPGRGLFSASGTVDGVRAVPAGVTVPVDSVDGGIHETSPRRPAMRPVDAMTLGAALATAALIFAMARLLAVAVPGVGLVTTTAMVFVVSLGVLLLPEAWRRGPRLGGGAVGGAIGVLTAVIAVTEAVRVIAAGTPFWATDLVGWTERASAWAPYGWQIPASLLLAAAVAWALLPAPVDGDVGFVTLALAGLAAPAAIGLGWWSPMLIGGSLTLVAGIGAALVGGPAAEGAARRRLGLAAVLAGYSTLAASVTPGSTAMMLSAIVAFGVAVAAIAQARDVVPPVVPGMAAAASLLAAPGAAATIAVESRASRPAILGAALAVAAFGVVVVAALRAARVRWGAYPAFGVGLAALTVALAALPDYRQSQTWAAAAAFVAVSAAATLRPDRMVDEGSARDVSTESTVEDRPRPGHRYDGRIIDNRAAKAVIVATVLPAAVIAAIASAPAWLTALVGPYRTLRQIWEGYAVAPVPENAPAAMVTLLLLAGVAAVTAVTLGGQRYVLASILPPLAALALLAPTALGAPRAATPWVALGVAVVTGLGAALSPPTLPSAARLLRGTAGVVCAVTGAAGLAGSLATRNGTLAALVVVLASAAFAAWMGRDPAVRMVAWFVASAAAFALPVTVFAVADRPLRPAAFGVLAVCAALSAVSWLLARTRRTVASTVPISEASVVDLCIVLGATFALLLALGSARHAAAVLTIWGLLLGAAALRRDRPAPRRTWLVRAALGAELGACWLLLYSVEVGLPEAYTLPFAGVALLAGALEMRRRRELSSWIAYGPALAGGFLPSLALVIVEDDVVWRWVTLFVAAIATVIVGSIRGRRAPVVTGGAVAVVVALVEMIRLLIQGAIAGAILVAVAGVVLIVLGAVSEQRLRGALRKMS